MFRSKTSPDAQLQATAFATRRDFQEIFTEDMAGLHLLALLLTADACKAEQCFVAGLEESIAGNPVFRQWARSWSKRAIVKNAIKMMAPAPGPLVATGDAGSGASNSHAMIQRVMRLPAFERFVLVMMVLEHYSAQECSDLLGRSHQAVLAARSQALRRLASLSASSANRPSLATARTAFLTGAETA